MSTLNTPEYKKFETIKTVRPDGTEFWYARNLATVLEYSDWRNFKSVIERAMIACENSGHSVVSEFVETKTNVQTGVSTKKLNDYELSRYACYLIVQNGDPRKEVIALGQTYFAIQTYRQEVADHFNQLDEDNLFRISQTEEKLRKDPVHSSRAATQVHYSVGKEVRAAIEKIGGTMPENLPTPEKSIQQIEKEQLARLKRKAKNGTPMLDE